MFFSTSVNKASEERVTRITREILDEFAREFPRWYTMYVVKKCKEEVTPKDQLEIVMEEAPLTAEPLKKGMLLKVS
jgi:hypothetical protein